MKLFGKHKIKKSDGMYGVSISKEGCCVAKTTFFEGKKPELEICDYSQWAKGVPDEKQIKEKIRELGLEEYDCSTVLGMNDYNLLNVETPDVPKEEVAAAVRWLIADMVDFDVSDAVIDVFESAIEGGQDKKNNVYVVAAPQEKIQEQVNLLQNAQVNLSVIDVPELVLLNLASLLPGNEEGVAMLYIERNQGLMVLVRESYIYLARRLDIGIEDIQLVNEGSGSAEQAPIKETNPQLEAMVLELLRTIDYYDRYFSLTPLSGLVIVPAVTEAPGFQESLTKMLGINVKYMDLNELLDCKVPLSKELQRHCFLAVGASLRVPQEDEDEEDENNVEQEGLQEQA